MRLTAPFLLAARPTKQTIEMLHQPGGKVSNKRDTSGLHTAVLLL
jgi:hypothetical protein